MTTNASVPALRRRKLALQYSPVPTLSRATLFAARAVKLDRFRLKRLLYLAPLAERGRSRSAAKASGEGDSPRARTRGESPSPGLHLTMQSDLSPQAGRGESL